MWVRLKLAVLVLQSAVGLVSAQEAVPLTVLTNAQQVLDLGIEGARRAPHPVHLRAVVTCPVRGRPWFYAQDATGGILVVCTNLLRPPSAGELVEIFGKAGPGLSAPHVLEGDFRVIGAAALPKPRRIDPARMTMGEGFGQWIVQEGNVLDYFIHPEQLSLLLQEGDHHCVVNIALTEPIGIPADWLGARLEVQGVCWTEARADGVAMAFRIHAPGTNNIAMLRPGPTSLFGWPLHTTGSLNKQRGARDSRVRVVGNVLLSLPSQALFLRDETGALQARLLKPISGLRYIYSVNADTLLTNFPVDLSWTNCVRPRPYIIPVAPGDRVEVVGTPTTSGLGTILNDAEYRRLGPGIAPTPVKVSTADLLSGRYEGELVTMRGRLVDRETHSGADVVEDLLVLRDGGTTAQVLFTAPRAQALPWLPENALLQVAGVCSSEVGEWKTIRAIRLLLRGPEDLTVLAQPLPWESWQVGRLLLIGGGLGIGALAWIGLLRHRVARRTAELALSNRCLVAEVEERKRAQTELSHALAAEKELNQLKSRFVSMVSHEFRTPLGVILSSADLLSDYLDTLSPEQRAEQLADIKKSTCHMAALMEDVLLLGRVESGRMGYHPNNFELVDFCRRLVDEILSATNRRCPLEFVEKGIDAPARGDEVLLRHMLHNLLANGVKYSPPGQPVRLSVERQGDDAIFTVIDHGIGISSEDQKYVFEAFYRGKNVGERAGTGLGLVVVKRCVELHGGLVRLHSIEGQGTTVTVSVPLFRPAGQTEFLHATPAALATQPL
jgi:signal transduction histidine kinase